jgi:hypothetical protein
MFRLRLALLVCIALLAAINTARAAVVFFANLTGSQEVPPNNSSAFGFGTFVLNSAQNQLSVSVTVFGLDVTGTQTPNNALDNLVNAHIHAPAPPGQNAGVRWGFIGAPFNDTINPGTLVPFANGVGGTFTSVWDATEGNSTTLTAQLPNILAGLSYVNFHTVGFPGGEIRGQILTPEPSTLCLLGVGALASFATLRLGKRTRRENRP